MKDYKLSKIQEICGSHPLFHCEECEFYKEGEGCVFELSSYPSAWDVDEEHPKDKIETLADTSDLMVSKDYKDRFKAEYYQLKIRYEKLDAMVKNWDNLSFEPTCSKETFNTQLEIMLDYLKILEVRAEIEDIKL